MSSSLKHARHLLLLVAVMLTAMLSFLAIRQLVIPKGFGRYGHYRPGAIDDNRMRPVSFAGQATCVMCHEDEAKMRATGKHQKVSCEACHGAQSKHAEDPSATKPPLPDKTSLCQRCHEADAAKPRGFPQVVSKEHSGGELCVTCHQPHAPKI